MTEWIEILISFDLYEGKVSNHPEFPPAVIYLALQKLGGGKTGRHC